MKRIKAVVALVVVMAMTVLHCSVAQAAQGDVDVVVGEFKDRMLSAEEINDLPADVKNAMEKEGFSVALAAKSSYVVHEYSQSFDFHLGDARVARAEASCIVWRYTDGKVHLYNRTITVKRVANYNVVRTYGSIVNTDGSLSYTTGDRISISNFTNTWLYALDFYATPTDQYFTYYEI